MKKSLPREAEAEANETLNLANATEENDVSNRRKKPGSLVREIHGYFREIYSR